MNPPESDIGWFGKGALSEQCRIAIQFSDALSLSCYFLMQINCIKLVFIVGEGKPRRKKWEYVQIRGRLTTGLAQRLQ